MMTVFRKGALRQSVFVENKRLPCNVTRLSSTKGILFFDTAYAEDMTYLPKWEVEKATGVFLSHDHPDHIGGNGFFPQCNFYASSQFDRRKQKVTPLQDGQILFWGKHQIRALETPGHSLDSMSFMIDEDIIYVGDLMIRQGKREVLPYISKTGDVEAHISSLKKIWAHRPKILLLGHGAPVYGAYIGRVLDERIAYLEALKTFGRNTTLDMIFSKERKKDYETDIHRYNLRALFHMKG